MTVKENDKVKVHYTGTLNNGEVFDSSEGKDPIEFTLGAGQIIPGFENALLGMAIDETKKVSIPAAEAYGELRQELIQEVPNAQLPPELKPEVGMQLMSKAPNGQELPLVVVEVKEETFVVDANHPLAGQDLNFELKVVGVN